MAKSFPCAVQTIFGAKSSFMLTQRPDQRVAVFIDTQNMYHTAKHIYNRKVSFANLVEAAVGPRILVRAIAYVAKSKDNVESAFFEALQQQGIELKIKDVQEFASGAKKADWDVGMAVDAIALSPKVDVVVLATGDGDFVPLVEYLKGHGVICEVVAFKESTNARLREVADSFLDLSAEPDLYLLQDSRKPGTKRIITPAKENTKEASRNIRITY
jgi:uncharacterized LabA/DUF88 family protein